MSLKLIILDRSQIRCCYGRHVIMNDCYFRSFIIAMPLLSWHWCSVVIVMVAGENRKDIGNSI